MSNSPDITSLIQEVNLNIDILMRNLNMLQNLVNRSAEIAEEDIVVPKLMKEILDVIVIKENWNREELVTLIREVSLLSLDQQRLKRR